jgi:hypothetical protein
MDSSLATLRRAIDAASSLAAELQVRPSPQDIDDFFSLCERFVDLGTKCALGQRTSADDITPDFSVDQLEPAHVSHEDLKVEVRAIELLLQSIEPERLQGLISDARRLLDDVSARLERSKGSDLDELMRLAGEELAQLEAVAQTHGWYEDAYRRLSEFTGVAIGEDGSIRLLGTHTMKFAPNAVSIDPPSVFVGDLDPGESSDAICISEVMERIAALNNLAGAAKALGWEIEGNRDAPIARLFPPGSGVPAVFALIGYQEHPLVEWGGVDPEEFNGTEQPLIEKLRRFAPGGYLV